MTLPYQTIERAIMDACREDAWIMNGLDIGDRDELEGCEQALLAKFYEYD